MRFIQGSVSAAVKDGETGDESQVLSSGSLVGCEVVPISSHLFCNWLELILGCPWVWVRTLETKVPWIPPP